jgi:group I intron endonuclease
MSMIIYKATNKINGKAYCGRSNKALDKRWDRHDYTAKRNTDNSKIHNAIRKYGKNNFILEVLCECDTWEILGIMETFYIIVHKTHWTEGGYNLTWGNDGISYGFKHSEKTKRKMSESRKGELNHQYGKHLSEETKRKLSDRNKGKIISKETKRKLSENHAKAMLGKHHSEESKQKMSASLKGRSVWNKGKKCNNLTEEHKRKISESVKKYLKIKQMRDQE